MFDVDYLVFRSVVSTRNLQYGCPSPITRSLCVNQNVVIVHLEPENHGGCRNIGGIRLIDASSRALCFIRLHQRQHMAHLWSQRYVARDTSQVAHVLIGDGEAAEVVRAVHITVAIEVLPCIDRA